MKKLGLIGLGKMGINLIQNMKRNGYEPIGLDVNKDQYDFLKSKGITTSNTVDELIKSLPKPRYVMMLVPSGKITEDLYLELSNKLEKGDCIIDAGNSFYKDSVRRGEEANKKGINFVDCGTSGGWSGALNGACFMVGGPDVAMKDLSPMLTKLAVKDGFLHTGKVGSGHYSKMIHNGIEYGMMQAIAEGYELLENSEFKYDYAKLSHVWNNGSVIRSWLIELMEEAFTSDKDLSKFSDIMEMNGEGVWTVEESLRQNTPAPVISLSVMMRQRSMQDESFAGKVVAALRFGFGGHAIPTKKK